MNLTIYSYLILALPFIIFFLYLYLKNTLLPIKKSRWVSFEENKILHLFGFNFSYGIDVDYKGNIFFPDFKSGLIYKIDKSLKVTKILKFKKNKLKEISLFELIILNSVFKKFINITSNIYKPHDIFFDKKNNMYITQMGLGQGRGQGKVSVFSKNNKLLYEIGKLDQKNISLIDPVMSFVKNEIIYVSECGADKILIYKKSKLIGWIGDKSLNKKSFTNNKNKFFSAKLKRPHAFKIGPDNNFYIVDTLNHRVCKYSKKGKFLGWIGKRSDGKINNNWSLIGRSIKGKELGAFNTPIDLVFLNNFIILSDCFNHRIIKISLDGKSLSWFGDTSKKIKKNIFSKIKETSVSSKNNLGLSRPFGIKIWKDQLYIADKNNYRVKIIKFKVFL